MGAIMKNMQAFLESIHPSVPWVMLTLAIWGAVYAIRRWAPIWWTAFELLGPSDARAATVFQALPSILGGAMVGVMLTGDDYQQAWKGALAGALSPLVHHTLKALPVPYMGAKGPDGL